MAKIFKRRTIKKAARRLIQVASHNSLKEVWFKLLFKTKVYRRFWVSVFPYDASSKPVDLKPDISCGLLDSTEVNNYMQFRQDQKYEEIHQRIEQGHLCFIARHNGRMVSSVWACANSAWVKHLDCELRLPPGFVYAYDLFTSLDYRGQGLSGMISYWRLQYLAGAGYHTAVSIVWPENHKAMRHFKKRGLSASGIIGRIKLGPWEHHFLKLETSTQNNTDTRITLVGTGKHLSLKPVL